jgi:hypothetical protein
MGVLLSDKRLPWDEGECGFAAQNRIDVVERKHSHR